MDLSPLHLWKRESPFDTHLTPLASHPSPGTHTGPLGAPSPHSCLWVFPDGKMREGQKGFQQPASEQHERAALISFLRSFNFEDTVVISS